MALLLAAPLSGCNERSRLFVAPAMSPVGSGFVANTDPALYELAPRRHPSGASLFVDGAANLFTDSRAMKVGDVITVVIMINDKASFGNTTGRSQTAQESMGFDWIFNQNMYQNKVNALGDLNSSSSSNGQGSIDRSEKVQLSIAAVVTRVLANGNLVISGTQEVRVNFEKRVLHVAGIVRPRDINSNNTIGYDKIAEARISYGGQGRISEVQQPAWGQQVFDALKPF
nr:flagellar basal body L-ring protein FlgH [Candidatus Rhodoblastus alkanivorans]